MKTKNDKIKSTAIYTIPAKRTTKNVETSTKTSSKMEMKTYVNVTNINKPSRTAVNLKTEKEKQSAVDTKGSSYFQGLISYKT